MAKTNIERFDEISAGILAHLYSSFPVPASVNPGVAGLTERKVLSYDPLSETVEATGEVDPETPFFESTLEWLVLAGFVSKKAVPVNHYVYVLTASGLQALKHVPQPSLGSETLGDKLATATKAGAKEVASSTLNQALALGTSLVLRGLGIDS